MSSIAGVPITTACQGVFAFPAQGDLELNRSGGQQAAPPQLPQPEVLGKGAQGLVIKAVHIGWGNLPVAVKLIVPGALTQGQLEAAAHEVNLLAAMEQHREAAQQQHRADDPDAASAGYNHTVRFLGTFAVGQGASEGVPPELASLNLHRKVASSGYGDLMIGVALELMSEGSLASHMRQLGTYPEDMAAAYMGQAVSGIAFLHENLQSVHGDIKGDNLLLTSDGRCCLSDFGTVRLESEATQWLLQRQEGPVDGESETELGTPYWLAPEVILMEQQTYASDIWTVGCTLLELVTGKPPYHDLGPMAAMFRMVQDEHPPIPTGITPKLKDVLLRCFEHEPSARPSARELLYHPWFVEGTSSFFGSSTRPHEQPTAAKAPVANRPNRPGPRQRNSKGSSRCSVTHLQDTLRQHSKSVSKIETPDVPDITQQAEQLAAEQSQLQQSVEAEISKTDPAAVEYMKVLDLLDQVAQKEAFVSRRVRQMQQQEIQLKRMADVYGKTQSAVAGQVEDRLRTLQNTLNNDLKLLEMFKLDTCRLKEVIYPLVRATSDFAGDSGESIPFVAGEEFFVLGPDTGRFFVESVDSGRQGYVPSESVELFKRTERRHTKLGGEVSSQVTQTVGAFAVQTKEVTTSSVISSVQANQKQSKIASLLGTANTSADSPQPLAKFSSPRRSQQERKSTFSRLFRSSRSKDDEELAHGSLGEGGINFGKDGANGALLAFLKQNPSYGEASNRSHILDSPIHVKTTGRGKLQERYAFLFSDILIICRVKRPRKHANTPAEWLYKVEAAVELEKLRVITLGDDDQSIPSFQVDCPGEESLTLSSTMAADRDVWLSHLRDMSREFAKARILALKSL